MSVVRFSLISTLLVALLFSGCETGSSSPFAFDKADVISFPAGDATWVGELPEGSGHLYTIVNGNAIYSRSHDQDRWQPLFVARSDSGKPLYKQPNKSHIKITGSIDRLIGFGESPNLFLLTGDFPGPLLLDLKRGGISPYGSSLIDSVRQCFINENDGNQLVVLTTSGLLHSTVNHGKSWDLLPMDRVVEAAVQFDGDSLRVWCLRDRFKRVIKKVYIDNWEGIPWYDAPSSLETFDILRESPDDMPILPKDPPPKPRHPPILQDETEEVLTDLFTEMAAYHKTSMMSNMLTPSPGHPRFFTTWWAGALDGDVTFWQKPDSSFVVPVRSDHGYSWKKSELGTVLLQPSEDNPNELLVVQTSRSPIRRLRSTDRGRSWTRLPNDSLVTTPEKELNHKVVHDLIQADFLGQAEKWRSFSRNYSRSISRESTLDRLLIQSTIPLDEEGHRFLAATSKGLFELDTLANRVEDVSVGLIERTNVSSFIELEGEPPTWLAATDQGLFRSHDPGHSWTRLSLKVARLLGKIDHPQPALLKVFGDTLSYSVDEGESWTWLTSRFTNGPSKSGQVLEEMLQRLLTADEPPDDKSWRSIASSFTNVSSDGDRWCFLRGDNLLVSQRYNRSQLLALGPLPGWRTAFDFPGDYLSPLSTNPDRLVAVSLDSLYLSEDLAVSWNAVAALPFKLDFEPSTRRRYVQWRPWVSFKVNKKGELYIETTQGILHWTPGTDVIEKIDGLRPGIQLLETLQDGRLVVTDPELETLWIVGPTHRKR